MGGRDSSQHTVSVYLIFVAYLQKDPRPGLLGSGPRVLLSEGLRGAPARLSASRPGVIGPLRFPSASAWLRPEQPNHRSCLIKPSTAPAAGQVHHPPPPGVAVPMPLHTPGLFLSLPQALGNSLLLPNILTSEPWPTMFLLLESPPTHPLPLWRLHSLGRNTRGALHPTPPRHFSSPTSCPVFP